MVARNLRSREAKVLKSYQVLVKRICREDKGNPQSITMSNIFNVKAQATIKLSPQNIATKNNHENTFHAASLIGLKVEQMRVDLAIHLLEIPNLHLIHFH